MIDLLVGIFWMPAILALFAAMFETCYGDYDS